MSALTRRRSDNPHHETWHVYYGDVHVGTIGERAGVPVDVNQWSWSCGFYPGLHPGQHRHGAHRRSPKRVLALRPTGRPCCRRCRKVPLTRTATRPSHRMEVSHVGLRLSDADANPRRSLDCFCGTEITDASVNAHIHERHMESESA